MMFDKIKKTYFTNKKVYHKMALSLFIIILFRLLYFVPVPFIQTNNLESLVISTMDDVSPFLSSMIGSFNLVGLSMATYITSSLILQVLTVSVPTVRRAVMKPNGQNKLNNMVRNTAFSLTVLISGLTVFFFNTLMSNLSVSPIIAIPTIALTQGLGTLIVIKLIRIIDDYGYGKGISLLILVSVLDNFWDLIKDMSISLYGGMKFNPVYWLYLLLFLMLLLLILFLENSEILKPIYTGGNAFRAGKDEKINYIPFKLNLLGIMPLAISNSFIHNFGTAFAMLSQRNEKMDIWFFNYQQIFIKSKVGSLFQLMLFLLIFSFIFSYSSIDVTSMSETMIKGAMMFEDVDPGRPTEKELRRFIKKMTLVSFGFLLLLFIGFSFLSPIGFKISNISSFIIVISTSNEIINEFKYDLKLIKMNR